MLPIVCRPIGCAPRRSSAVPALTSDHASLGLAIRELRLAAGFSQESFADACGLHRTYIGGIERGERNVSFTNIIRIAAALGVRPSELLAHYERLAEPPARS